MLNYLLFDLDNTLYSSACGLEDNVRRRMQEYSAAFLGLSAGEAWKERMDKVHIYGTNLEWLMAEKDFTDIEDYLAVVHPADEADCLPPNPELRKFLAGISVPSAILTNSPREHVDRILSKLDLEGIFTHIFDIRLCNFIGKPQPVFFRAALNILGVQSDTVLFIDDSPRYVEGFIKLGGQGVLLDENNLHPNFPHPRIRRLEELSAYLERL